MKSILAEGNCPPPPVSKEFKLCCCQHGSNAYSDTLPKRQQQMLDLQTDIKSQPETLPVYSTD